MILTGCHGRLHKKRRKKNKGTTSPLRKKKYLQFRGRHTFKRLSNLKNIIFEIEARDLIFRQLFFLSAVGQVPGLETHLTVFRVYC